MVVAGGQQAFALIGIGLLVLAGDARSRRRRSGAGAGWSLWAAGTAGIVLLPGWLLWTWLSPMAR